MSRAPHSLEADGAVLLSPAGAALAELVESASRAYADMPFTVAGMPAGELRRQARAELAGQAALDAQAAWVVTAHQAELVHTGVWFKDAAAVALAEALGARPVHLVADVDVVKHDALRLPRLGDDAQASVEMHHLVEPADGQCPAQFPPPAPAAVESLLAWAAPRIAWECLFDRWAQAARQAALSAGSLAEWFAASQSAVGAELGVRLPNAFMSRLCRGPAFARFAADMAIRHRQMHRAHTEALAEYRAATGVNDPTQPVPDLKSQEAAWELPLWAYRGQSPRQPVFVSPAPAGLRLHTPAGPLVELPTDGQAAAEALAALPGQGVLLAPRALTLTMFVRTFLADLFIHGLGGARYEQAGDALMRRWFGWQPPPFITATATLQLPLRRLEATAGDLGRFRWHAHHAWHNPRLYARPEELNRQADSLTRRKRQVLKDLKQLPRASEVRGAAFDELQEVNAHLRQVLAGAVDRPARQVEQIRRALAYNAVAAGREYFFALMPRARLAGLVDQARQWAAGAHGAAAAAVRGGNSRGAGA